MRKNAEHLWAHHKYEVMFHSQKHYGLIRETLKETDDTVVIQNLITEAQAVSPTTGSVLNTFDHMWGYFKKICLTNEKERYLQLKTGYKDGLNTENDLIQFIKQMAEKYQVFYLLQSTILDKAFR